MIHKLNAPHSENYDKIPARMLACHSLRSINLILICLAIFSVDAEAGAVDVSKRATFEEFAAQKRVDEATIVRRHSASVVIRCNGKQGSAQLTGNVATVTTSAHLFIDRETCKPKATADQCEITVKTLSGLKKFRGFEMVDFGYRKAMEPQEACPTAGLRWTEDWAILRLTNRQALTALSKEASPYAVPSAGRALEARGVTAVSGAAKDFSRVASNGTKYYPRNIQECSIRDVWPSDEGAYFETDCDSALLTSGGALLQSDGARDTLVGIHMGSYESPWELKKAIEENRVNVRPYKSGEWTGLYVAVDGEFLRVLQHAIDDSDGTASPGAKAARAK